MREMRDVDNVEARSRRRTGRQMRYSRSMLKANAASRRPHARGRRLKERYSYAMQYRAQVKGKWRRQRVWGLNFDIYYLRDYPPRAAQLFSARLAPILLLFSRGELTPREALPLSLPLKSLKTQSAASLPINFKRYTLFW